METEAAAWRSWHQSLNVSGEEYSEFRKEYRRRKLTCQGRGRRHLLSFQLGEEVASSMKKEDMSNIGKNKRERSSSKVQVRLTAFPPQHQSDQR